MEKGGENGFKRIGVEQGKNTENLQGLSDSSGDICITIGSRSSRIRSDGSSDSGFCRLECTHAEGHRDDRTVDHRDFSDNIERIGRHLVAISGGLSNAPKGQQKGGDRVDSRNHERVSTNRSRTSHHSNHRLRDLPIFRKLQMVRKAVLKPVIPFAALSAGFMAMSIHKAQAAGLKDTILTPNGPLSLFQGSKVITPFGNPFSILRPKFADNMDLFFATMSKIIVFFQSLPHNMVYYTNVLTGKVFEWLLWLLQTPLFIFNATNIHNTSLVFSGISVLIVTILTIIEGVKRMLKVKHTDVKRIYNRYFVALAGAGIAPILFEKSFALINTLVRAVGQIGGKEANANLPPVDFSPLDSASEWLSALGLIAFDITLVAVLIPVLLQNARRFFDLMVLCAITPLALTAWIFDDYRHMFSTWWTNVKKMSMTPLVYSIFVCMIGLLIFGTHATTWSGLFMKLIIIIGGLYRMQHPPSFLKREMDADKDDIEDRGFEAWENFKKLRNNFRLKNFRLGRVAEKKIEANRVSQRKARVERGTRSK